MTVTTGDRLHHEWLHTVDQPWAAEVIADLPVRPGTLPHQLPAAIRTDPQLARATVLAAQQDGLLAGLACQALLQVVFPMLTRMARRDPSSSLDDYLAEAWLRIRTGKVSPATTVPTTIGLDALYAVCQPRRRLAAREIPWEIHDMPVVEKDPDQAQLALAVLSAAVALGIVARSQLPLLSSVYVLEMPSYRAGRAHRMSAEAVRARCSRAIRRMRRHAGEIRGYLE